MVYANKFNENSDLSMKYLGQMKMTRDTKIKAEERFPITGQGFTSGKLLDGTECQILLDTGATKSYMSKSYYLWYKTLHDNVDLVMGMKNIFELEGVIDSSWKLLSLKRDCYQVWPW